MSDKYTIRCRVAGYTPPDEWRTLQDEFLTEKEAQQQIEDYMDYWQTIYEFAIIPPPYTPPAITAEMDLETRAGSPRGVESDLLGLP